MSIKFIKSATKVADYFIDKRNQICFVGRSNVGKSSLINALANNSKLAKVSKTPGRTKLVNFFDFNDFVLVDLPGYGYAKTDYTTRENIYQIMIEYLNYNDKLKVVFQLCNIDVLTEDDLLMSEFLEKSNFNHFIILTKLDRVNKSHFDNNKHKIAKFLKVNEDKLIPVSSLTKQNIDKLNRLIKSVVKNEK